MNLYKEVTLTRDCDAIQIPSGQTIIIPSGMTVVVTQALGGSYTVATPGGLARIAEKDAVELGLTELKDIEQAEPQKVAPSSPDGEVTKEQVWEQLKTVYDPEIPVNIVDLGLVYDCSLKRDEAGVKVHVAMTLTAPGCGMGPTIAEDAKTKILSLGGITDAEVELVWDPPWNQEMISEVGKMKLGLI